MHFSLVEFIEAVPLKRRGPRQQSFQEPAWEIWDDGFWIRMRNRDNPDEPQTMTTIFNVRVANPVEEPSKPAPAAPTVKKAK